ncbi:MAG: hypothetical protein IT580_13045 [Verrucomicrobiales bacterium]|nr:hypothetical protein [Verrucomicrobiales bacterium]
MTLLVLMLMQGLGGTIAKAQVDPYHRSMLQMGYDQPINGRGPRGVYAYYYYNKPDLIGTNVALRVALAPAYVDGELGLRELISPHTDLGLGFYGGAYGDNYYEVRNGRYLEGESFDGHGGGAAISLYQLVNPAMRIPLHLIARAGFRYTAYAEGEETDEGFEVPESRPMPFARVGLRWAGKEPVLYPDLGLEVSAWVERQWRLEHGDFGFGNDRSMKGRTDLYWVYAGLDYAWTNVGHRVSLAVTAGGSSSPDRFSAWRLGGVLPLIAEFPLILPGYYYQELSAERFVHLHASYLFPLDSEGRFQFRVEAASARLEYLPGFEQPDDWQTGVGCGVTFTPKSKRCRIVARYGYGFNAVRGERDHGGHSVGLLMQYDFDRHPDWWR